MQSTPIFRAPDADFGFIGELKQHKAKKGQHYRNDKRFLDIITAFDIETSRIDIDGKPESYMYIWQWQFGDVMTVIGRTWEEFVDVYNKIVSMLSEDRQMVVYVHNLSYEFQFLAGVLDMNSAEIFATDLRKVLYFRLNNLEFRCSLRLANQSLDKWTKDLGVEHKKLSGDEFDYSETRYPWTELTDKQLAYCVNDVIGVVECVEKTLALHGDSLYSIPMTATGYIRRMVKKAMNSVRLDIHKMQNSLEVYDALRLAYRGGDTHANSGELGLIIPEVFSYDRSSSYPDVMMHCRYPVTRFRNEAVLTEKALNRLVKEGRAILAKVSFYGIRKQPWNSCPYISYSKCFGGDLKKPFNVEFDNGRVVSADYCNLWVTDIDLMLILKEYLMTGIKIDKMYSARYGYLPKPFTEIIKKLYKDKTELKNIPEKEEDYKIAKSLLNSTYGMTVQRVITPASVFINGEWKPDTTYDRIVEYDKATKKAFLNYAWGVWVCAWARLRLHQGIECAGWDNFIYCDTDSVKSIADLDIKAFNNARIADAKRSGAWAIDTKGEAHYMGVFEKEETYDKFTTLGAKRYAYIIKGKLGMTCAGVSKKRGAGELEEMGGLPAFKEGVVFNKAGHIAAYYNDDTDCDVQIDGHTLHIGRNVCLVETPYKLTLAGDVSENVLKNFVKMLDYYENTDYNDNAFRDGTTIFN